MTEPADAPTAAAAERQGSGKEESSDQPGLGPEEVPAAAAQEADGQIDDVPEPPAVHTPAPEDGPLLQEARPAAAAAASSGGAAGGAGGVPFMPGAGPNVDPQQVQQIAQMVKVRGANACDAALSQLGGVQVGNTTIHRLGWGPSLRCQAAHCLVRPRCSFTDLHARSGTSRHPLAAQAQYCRCAGAALQDNPSLMQMAADNMRSMSDEQLAQALAQGGQQGVTPAMARAMAESLRGMPQEQLRWVDVWVGVGGDL